MRPSVVVREALSTAVSRPFFAFLIVLTAMVALALPAAWEVSELQNLAQRVEEAEARGSNVVIVSDQEEGVSAFECEKVASWVGVVHAGWFKNTGTVQFEKSARNPLQKASASSSYLEIVDPSFSPGTGGLVLGAAAAKELGAPRGATLSTSTVGDVVDTDRRAPGQARWVYDVRSAGLFMSANECWVEAQSGSTQTVARSLRAAFSPSPTIEVRYLYEGVSSSDWTQRPSQYAWIAAVAVTLLPVTLTVYIRRSEIALYVTSGVRRMDAAFIYAFAHGFLVAVGATGAVALTLFAHLMVATRWHETSLLIGITAVISGAAATFSLTAVVATAVAMLPLATSVKDRT